jgi:hypothetical protein
MENEKSATRPTIHFLTGDPRFCGSTQQWRRVTVDPNDVTCERCQSRDTFVLSPQGAEYVASLERGQ